ncbi:MAG: TolC family protein [Bacteroidota bacterium]
MTLWHNRFSVGKLVMVYLLTMTIAHANAQNKSRDTLSISLQEAEKIFVDSNLVLLATHYNVDAQKALIQQAKLWDNPVLNTDQVISAGGKFFPYGKNPDGSYSGQYFIQVQQLIKTAGKRNKLINLATTNAKLSEWQLQDVLRNLRYQLRTDYYSIIQQLGTRHIYEGQLQQLNKLLNGMAAQLNAGNIAQKDYLRIQALVISLQQDITELDKTISDTENDLKTLLQIKNESFIKPTEAIAPNISLATTVDVLAETAKQNNPYYQLQQTQTLFQQQNLSYQKSLRVPDLTLGPNFDRNSNFAPNYVGLGISLPLTILNKNQGNIKSAEYSVKQQQTITNSAETELRNNISNAYAKLLLTLQQNNSVQKEFYTRYQSMYNNILQSYQQKQINLLEFLDFFNDYTASQQRLLQQQLNLQLAKEELNFHAGIDIIK